MGIFDSIKSAFGKADRVSDATVAPSRLLRDAGLDPSGLRFRFGQASIAVSGRIAHESDRLKILDILSAIPGIQRVDDDLVVASAGPDFDANADASDAPEGARTYTVVSGDTLWKIAERMYGNGSQYMKIFEANTGVVEHPDRIFPGQKLVIPEL
jgi:hypothetical protein